MSAAPAKVRYESVDLVKGVLTIKMVIAHTAFFVAWWGFYHATDVGMIFTFPALFFTYGIGSGFSSRRKPAWPFFALLGAFVFASVANEALLDRYKALELAKLTPFPGDSWDRFLRYITLSDSAHYTDYIPPYLLAVGFVLLADRLGRPLKKWHWAALAAVGLTLHFAGRTLDAAEVAGPGSVFWNKGFCAFQWFPLFIAGVLIAKHGAFFCATPQWPRRRILLWMCAKLALLTAVGLYLALMDLRATDVFPPRYPWRHVLFPDVIPAAFAGTLLIVWIASDLIKLLPRWLTWRFVRLGRRMLVSLVVQFVGLPIVGFAASHFQTEVRILFGVAWILAFTGVMLFWDEIWSSIQRLRRRKAVEARAAA